MTTYAPSGSDFSSLFLHNRQGNKYIHVYVFLYLIRSFSEVVPKGLFQNPHLKKPKVAFLTKQPALFKKKDLWSIKLDYLFGYFQEHNATLSPSNF